jgi:hypothetical protein
VDAPVWREILGYLNFSGGSPDARFERNLSDLYAALDLSWTAASLQTVLLDRLKALRESAPEFANSAQAEAVIGLTLGEALPAYRRFHADLLFHLSDEQFVQPFFVARMFEAVLAQGGPWTETERVVRGTLEQLNDFLGYRPLPVLENGRQMEPYRHERYRPLPLYIRDAGAAAGLYQALIDRTIQFFREAPADLLRDAYFDLDRMDELALDVRAHDHTHPANKRTNYMFGEWDPHQIDTKGFYRRFIVRRIILDALVNWMAQHSSLEPEERLYDASAVLCGTMLMASSISGYGPETHDSNVTLTSLLPRVARQRDAFYTRLLEHATGPRAERLRREAEATQQPFGHVRQQLNIELSNYGARQVQYRSLAHLLARMGYADAAQETAAAIPSASIRFECDLQWRIRSAELALDHGDPEAAFRYIREIEDLLHRGIECGALVDPWNVLGFQGQYPLFTSREDSVPDQRVDVLLDLMEQTFGVYSGALSEAAAQGLGALREEISTGFEKLADFWDRFATTTVDELPKVSGRESWQSARHVADALTGWREAGEAAGDITYWRGQVDQFQSAKAYAQVVEALLARRDHIASMGLLMQWLSEAETVGLESGPYSLNRLLVRWMQLVTDRSQAGSGEERWRTLRRLFDYLEANAGEFWSLEGIEPAAGLTAVPPGAAEETGADLVGGPAPDEFDEGEDLFGAAYEGVVFRDSALDGIESDTMDEGYDVGTTEFEIIARHLEPRLAFIDTLARLWQTAAVALAVPSGRRSGSRPRLTEQQIDVLAGWVQRTVELQDGLQRLMMSIWSHEVEMEGGDHDANVEFDIQWQTKSYLLHTAIATSVRCRDAQRLLCCCLPASIVNEALTDVDRQIVGVYRPVLQRQAVEVRRRLPALLRSLGAEGLLYVPCNHGGHPKQMLDARNLQSVMRFLVEQLPQLGLLRDASRVLETAYRMERNSHPGGQAVTEFDRLFRTALKSSAECIIRSAPTWQISGIPAHILRRKWRRRSGAERTRRVLPRRALRPSRSRLRRRNAVLVETLVELVERYRAVWLKHSRTMRLSTVESLKQKDLWRSVRDFIRRYGDELFQSSLLTLGNLRAVLHTGIDDFLDYLAEIEDPHRPSPLLRDLETGVLNRERVIEYLELVYGSVVDRIDRFVEYNTTTTQSDYGEMFYCFLDFLRIEASYERDAWQFIPYEIAHEALAGLGQTRAALAWEQYLRKVTSRKASQHLSNLRKLEKAYAMRLPSVRDRLNERFVKPLAVNRMVALVPRAMEDARHGRGPSPAFEVLRAEMEAYMADTAGSAIDVAPWLRSLEQEVSRVDTRGEVEMEPGEPIVHRTPIPLSLRQLRRQLALWDRQARKSGS